MSHSCFLHGSMKAILYIGFVLEYFPKLGKYYVVITVKFGKTITTMKCYPLFARLLCALEGNYLEANSEPVEHVDVLEGHVQCLKFSCSVPAVTGRGFIEVMTIMPIVKLFNV